MTEEKAREINRVQKTLEDTNLKLGDVVSDIMGKASRMILQAIVDGETDPARLAALAVGRVRAPQAQLEAALKGHVTAHHRFLLQEHLTQIRQLEQAIDRITAEILRRFTPPSPPEETTASEKEDETTPERVCDGATQRDGPTALSWGQAVALHGTHSRHRRTCRHWHLSRNRDEYAAISDCRPFGLVGRNLSWLI